MAVHRTTAPHIRAPRMVGALMVDMLGLRLRWAVFMVPVSTARNTRNTRSIGRAVLMVVARPTALRTQTSLHAECDTLRWRGTPRPLVTT